VIFVTVGTQLAFDRLIEAVDEWAGERSDRQVFAQVGPTKLRPLHIQYKNYISPSECRARMRGAKAIVAHAGMGTILAALELGKPLVVMPRRAALGEHRSDHQLGTVQRLATFETVEVALDENELQAKMDRLDGPTAQGARISPHAPDGLIATVRDFIEAAS
jgi:UDP-N-acetylglucosamine transferase subunit ALG13